MAAITFPLACPPTTTDEAKAAFIAANLAPDRFGEYLRDPMRRLLVAERNGGVIGYTMLVLPAEPSTGPADSDVAAAVTVRPTAELSKVYVLPEHHGGGAARRLVEATLRVAADEGIASVWLGVNQLNDRANAFYAKCGFSRVGTKRFLVGDVWEHDFVREHVFSAEIRPQRREDVSSR